MKTTILIVDDERSIRFTIKEFLLKEGYEVFEAKDFEEALNTINSKYLDIILTDIVLGDKTGIDLLGKVSEKRINCPVILFTGYPNIETASEAVRLGAYDYMSKPVEKGALLHIVRMAIRHKELVEEKNKNHTNLEAIFRSVKDAIITVDKDLNIIEANDAARTICGFPREKTKGRPFNSIAELCNRKCIEAMKKTISEKQPVDIYRFECNHTGHKGQLVSINTFPLIYHQEEISGCVIIIKDETEIVEMEKELENRKGLFNIVGKDEKMQHLYSMIEYLYNIDTTVLITGESGTGKGLIAEALHYGGERRQGPFVKVDCSALMETLLESELFGHSKGAFTGAVANKTGRFKRADGGTIFLDEIGDVSLSVQQRLLKVIQEKEFECVGDSTPIKVDVRVVAATNKDLKEKVRLGKFREDLYYRLKVVVLSPPPLRDRRGDIPILVEHIIKKFNQKLKKNIEAISRDVYKIFMEYKWSGNIRELENVLEHAFVVCKKSVITVEDIPRELKEGTPAPFVGEKRSEYNTVLQALEKTRWNKTHAARLLGMSRRTIYNKIKEYNIRPE